MILNILKYIIKTIFLILNTKIQIKKLKVHQKLNLKNKILIRIKINRVIHKLNLFKLIIIISIKHLMIIQV